MRSSAFVTCLKHHNPKSSRSSYVNDRKSIFLYGKGLSLHESLFIKATAPFWSINISGCLGYNRIISLVLLYISSLYRYRNGGTVMCDVKKYEKIYEDIKTLQPEDTLQLVLEAETEEQRSFYEMVGDFLLQKKQRQVIERNLF